MNAAATNTIARQLPEAKQAYLPAIIQQAEQKQQEQDKANAKLEIIAQVESKQHAQQELIKEVRDR